jgi:hypothetical protein
MTSPRTIRSADADAAFARVDLTDTCIDAANRTARMFHGSYPGWEMYSRIARGDAVYDRKLAAWAIWMARSYARATKVNGHAVVAPRGRRNNWIAQAGLDALDFTVYGYYGVNAHVAAAQAGVDSAQYRRFRGVLSMCMIEGFENYRAELHYQYRKVCRDELMAA